MHIDIKVPDTTVARKLEQVPLSGRETSAVPSLLLDSLLGLGLLCWVGADGGVGLGVHLLHVLGVDTGLDYVNIGN